MIACNHPIKGWYKDVNYSWRHPKWHCSECNDYTYNFYKSRSAKWLSKKLGTPYKDIYDIMWNVVGESMIWGVLYGLLPLVTIAGIVYKFNDWYERFPWFATGLKYIGIGVGSVITITVLGLLMRVFFDKESEYDN